MNRFKFDSEKAIEAIKLILANTEGTLDYYKIFKILYFADLNHIAKYGSPIFGDRYIAMKDGPVPSHIYDEFKSLRYNSETLSRFNDNFKVNGYYVSQIKPVDLDLLSKSEIDALINSIQDNKHLSYGTLTKKAHGLAWESADRDNDISIFDMAKEAGASEDLLKYINHQIEIESVVNDVAW